MAIITVSRGAFTGGQVLAVDLAERLGFPCVSREQVIAEATACYAIPADRLTTAMNEPPSFLQRLMGQRTTYLVFLQAALCEQARRGDLVYHGYVGHLLLPGVSHVIRVRVIADTKYRIRVATQELNLTQKDAVALIQRVDRERKEWIRFLLGVDWDDPSLYDVVLNLGRLSPEAACETVAHLAELEEFKPTAQSLKAMENLALSSLVSAALAADPRTSGEELRVAVEDGVVTVGGSIMSNEVADAIPLVAGQVEGVERVRCDVAVVPHMAYMDT